jgi:hypothetical protein
MKVRKGGEAGLSIGEEVIENERVRGGDGDQGRVAEKGSMQ